MLTRFIWGFGLLALLAWCGPGLGAPARPADPSPASSPMPPIGKDNPVHITADTMVYEAPAKLLHLDGHVHFDMKDAVLETAHAEFNTATQLGRLTGGVKITQPGSTVTADHMLIFYAHRRALLAGGVHLVTIQAKPGTPEPSATPTVPTTLDCDELEYFWEQQLGNAVGHVHVQQGDKKATSDIAHYTGDTQLVTLQGHVQFAQGEGDWVRAPQASLNMKDQTFVADGGVQANLYLDQESKPGKTPPHGKRPTGGTPRVMVPALAPQLQPVVPLDVPSGLPGSNPSPH